MFSKFKDKAKAFSKENHLFDVKDKSSELLEQQVPKIQSLLKEKIGPKALEAIEDDEQMGKVFNQVYDLLILSHPALRLILKRDRFIDFCLNNRSRLIERLEASELISPTEPAAEDESILPRAFEEEACAPPIPLNENKPETNTNVRSLNLISRNLSKRYNR